MARSAPSTCGVCSSVTVAVPPASSTFAICDLDEVARLEEIRRRRPARPGVALAREVAVKAPEAHAGGAGLGRRHDDGGHDVAGGHRPQPAVVLEALDRVALGEDVAGGTPPAVALVVGAQPVLERGVRDLLQPDVERRRHRQAVFVEHLGAVLPLEVLADLFDEERRDARRLVRLAARDDRLRLRRVRLRLRDVALVGHALQHDVAAGRRALHVDERALALGQLEEAGDERRFLERQLLVGLVEVEPGRRLDRRRRRGPDTSGCSRS